MYFDTKAPLVILSRCNDKILKKENVILFDKPSSWYSYHTSIVGRGDEFYKFLSVILTHNNIIPIKSHPNTALFIRDMIGETFNLHKEFLHKFALEYEIRYILYRTKTVTQYVGILFGNKKKELLFKIKYPTMDYREYEKNIDLD